MFKYLNYYCIIELYLKCIENISFNLTIIYINLIQMKIIILLFELQKQIKVNYKWSQYFFLFVFTTCSSNNSK